MESGLPKGWCQLTVGDFVNQPVSGVSVVADDEAPLKCSPGILRLSCVSGGRFNPSDLKTPFAGEVHRLGAHAEANSIIVSRSNTPDLVGASAFVRESAPGAFLPDTLWMLRPKGDFSCMRWLSYLLQSDFMWQNIRSIAHGTSHSMKKIQKGSFLNLPVMCPSPSERKKISEILVTWDEALEKLDALIVAKERCKQALMQQLLTGKRRLPGSPAPVRFIKASELFTNRTERNDRGAPILSVTQDQGVVARDSLERKITHDTDTNDTYKVVYPGDYIISLRSFQGGLEYSEILGAVSPAYHVIHPVEAIDREFYRHYFKSAHFIGHLAVAVIGIRDGKQISFTDFGFIKLPYPHIDDQKRIGRILSAADSELRLLRQQRTHLDQQKRGLMQQLLTGKKRVTA